MARPDRWFGYLFVALVTLVWLAPAGMARTPHRHHHRQHRLRASIGLEFSQCANASSGIGRCVGEGGNTGWVTGAVNENNSLYREGDFVPFRLVATGLVAGQTYTLGIGYDAVEKSLHTYDSLGTYDASENSPGPPAPQVVPCGGIGDTAGPHACGNTPSTLTVPTDTHTTFPDGSHPPPQPGNHFSAWGAALASAQYDSALSQPIGVHNSGTIERGINLTLTANGPTAVVAWGGHLASVLDWGQGNTFKSGGGSGASYHMRLTSGGNRELAINTDAIAGQPSFATQVTPTAVTTDQTVIDSATLTGTTQQGNVTGQVQFFVCGPAASAQAASCLQGGTPVGGPQVVDTVGGGPNGQATIAFPQPGAGPIDPGNYCFRAEYTPSAVAQYSPAVHPTAFTTTECFVVTLPPPRLTVTKLCVPEDDPGLFNLLLDGSTVPNGTDVPCGGSRGPFDTTAGTHTVSESAGTGTSLGNYTSTIGGDCAADGSITLALGDSATCTITNTRLGDPTGFLTVSKACVPTNDPGQFEIRLDGVKVAELSCGETTVPIELAPGGYTVSEASGVRTSRSDYTTVISGDCAADGSVTVVANETRHCTITNTRIPPTTTLTVRKICFPVGDDGHFRVGIFTVAGHRVHRVVLTCRGTTGAVTVRPGTYVVRERGANGTNLSDYHRFIGGDCLSDGTVTVEAGDRARCRIVNVHRRPGPQPAELTVIKICQPADDGGRFNLTVDGQTQTDVACGGSFGPVAVPAGQHHVSESAGTGTSLSDYTTTIGGACAADGSVTLAAGQQATCAITNVRTGTSPPEPPDETGTVEIEKQCLPAGTKGHFQLEFDEHVFYVACGESTGTVVVPLGEHRVGEVAVGRITSRYTTTIGGDCAPDGSFTLSAGEHVVCIVTNTLVKPEPPLIPPSACYTLSARPRTAIAGKRVRVVARVHTRRRGVRGVQVFLRGPSVSTVRTTRPGGLAVFLVTPSRRGILSVSIRKAFDCPKRPPKNIGVAGATTPPVTG